MGKKLKDENLRELPERQKTDKSEDSLEGRSGDVGPLEHRGELGGLLEAEQRG